MDEEIPSLVNIEAVERNCHHISTLIGKVAFLAIHQLSFRGKIDAFESKDEERNGLLFSLFNYTLEKDQRLCANVKLFHKMQRTLVQICKTNLFLL